MQQQDLVDDTFAAMNKGHLDEEFKQKTGDVKKLNMFGSIPDERADNDSSRFPPISKRSANFNQEDYMRSLDPLDDLADQIN